ncbi:UNVERIFIED_ORG: hypothetical protein FHR35_007931 [Microbispora rosea subsp. rosea]
MGWPFRISGGIFPPVPRAGSSWGCPGQSVRVRVCWWCGGAPAVVGRGFRMSRGRPRGDHGGRGGGCSLAVAWRGVAWQAWCAWRLACVACRPEWGAVGAVPPGGATARCQRAGPDTGSQPARRPRKGAGQAGARTAAQGRARAVAREERSGREGGPQRRPSGAGFARTGPSDRRSDVPTPPTPTPPTPTSPTPTHPTTTPHHQSSRPERGTSQPNRPDPTEHPHHERPRPGCSDLPPNHDRALTATPSR